VFLEISAIKFLTVIFNSGQKFHLIFGRKNSDEKKDAISYLLFPHNLDKIPAKITAVMLVKNARIKHFLRPVNFVGILAVITVFFAQKNRPLGSIL
jgi:hypothetical protein